MSGLGQEEKENMNKVRLLHTIHCLLFCATNLLQASEKSVYREINIFPYFVFK